MRMTRADLIAQKEAEGKLNHARLGQPRGGGVRPSRQPQPAHGQIVEIASGMRGPHQSDLEALVTRVETACDGVLSSATLKVAEAEERAGRLEAQIFGIQERLARLETELVAARKRLVELEAGAPRPAGGKRKRQYKARTKPKNELDETTIPLPADGLPSVEDMLPTEVPGGAEIQTDLQAEPASEQPADTVTTT